MKSAPIAFFAYKRPEHTKRSLESLSQNEGAELSELFIFCDGAKNSEDQEAVSKVKKVVHSKQWCATNYIIEREQNLGLANSIIQGVTDLCDRFGRVIVIEDDLILSPYFLQYMNIALDRYAEESRVMQISGHMFPVDLKTKYDTIFLPFTTSWGWATWQRAWKNFDPEMLGYEILRKDRTLQHQFNLSGSYPYFSMLEAQRSGQIDSWAIRWYLSVFTQKGLTLYPVRSLVRNIGFDGSGTHYKSKSDLVMGINYQPHQKVNSFPDSLEIGSGESSIIFQYFSKYKSRKRVYLISLKNYVKKFLQVLSKLDFVIKLFKKYFALFLYQYLTKVMIYGEKMERASRLNSIIEISPSVKIYPEANIENLSNNPELIKVNANSVIRGQLLIFAHAGKIEIGKDCYLGEGSRVWSASSIRIGDRVLISHNVNIHDTDSHPIDPNLRHQHFIEIMSVGHPKIYSGMVSKPVIIEDDVWIGFNAIILKGVKVGEKSIIGAGSVVTKDVPSHSIVVGNPAKVIYKI